MTKIVTKSEKFTSPGKLFPIMENDFKIAGHLKKYAFVPQLNKINRNFAWCNFDRRPHTLLI